jgi:hypothetical protein
MHNVLVTLGAALVPMIMGFVWYNPKVMGNAWIKETGLSEEELKKANMTVVFSVTFLLSILLAIFTYVLTIHQMGLNSMLMSEPGYMEKTGEAFALYNDLMARFGSNFRTFKHGAFHGVIAAIFFALPVIGFNALFERKTFKYIFIHLGYWILTLALMGGIVCQWAQV